MRRWPRHAALGAVVLLGLAGSSMMFSPVRDGVCAALLLADFVAGERPSLFKSLTSEPEVSSDTLHVNDSLSVPFDLFSPASEDPAAAIIFAHGLAHRGNQDPRVRSQALRLARAGFTVMTPDLAQMKSYELGFRDADAVVACVEHLRRTPGVDRTKIGVFAPSFGAGPVLIAISRPQIRDHVRFGLTFGGYFNLAQTLRYTLTGEIRGGGHTGRVDIASNRHNRWKFLGGNLNWLPPSPSRDQELKLLVGSKLKDPRLDIHPALGRITDLERRMVVFIDNEDPAAFDSLFSSLPSSIHARLDTMSLYRYTPDIRAKLLIAHSESDTKVPFTESLLLSQHLPNAPPPKVFIMGVFEHVDLKLEWDSFRAVRQDVLPGLTQLWSVVYHLLRQQR